MESRRDYRRLMNIKKRNKNYAKLTILASLGLGVALANSTTTHALEREWTANTSTTIKAGDTEYRIIWGDTLSLISQDSGITMDTLANLNNILNYDLIFEGNIISFGKGATATVKDSDGNVIAETPLTEKDKAGIEQAQKNNTNVNNNSTSNGTTNSNNNGVINTVKPIKPSTGNGNGGATNPIKPVDPTNPIKPVEPTDPTNPQVKEYTITINHVSTDGEVLSKETRKAKQNTTVEAKALDFKDRGYELVGESMQTITVKENTTITFRYKKIDDTKPVEDTVNIEIKHIGDDGKVLSTETIKAEKDSTVKADAKDFTDMGYVLNDEISKSIKAVEGASIVFNYRKVDTPTEDKMLATRTYFDVDTEDYIGTDTLEVTLKDGKAIVKADTIPTGYKLAEGETGVREVSRPQSTASFKVEKIDKEVPETQMDVKVGFQADGTVISMTTMTGQIDGDFVEVTVSDKDIPTGYELDDDATKEMTVAQAQAGEVLTFNIKKEADIPTPVEKSVVTTQYVAEDGTKLADNKVQEVEKGTLVKETAIQIDGYKVIGDSTQSVVANSNKTITFTYAKDEKPYEPVHTESSETRVIDENGTNLGQVVPDGYDIVSVTYDEEVVTQANGDTHTTHVTFINVKKAYVPVHTSETVVVNVDVNGTVLTDTSNYDYVSESTDGGKVTTQPNGDTHTVFTKTVVWKVKEVAPTNPYMGQHKEVIRGEYNGVFYEGLGNSGMVWADQLTASYWALTEIGFNAGSYETWQVRVAGTNEIMWTAHLR